MNSAEPVSTWVVRALASALLATFALVGAGPDPAAASSTPRPRISRLSTTSGPTSGGTSVRVTGRHFTRRTRVYFGGVHARTRYRSTTRLRVTTPAHRAGRVYVVARTGRRRSRVTVHTRFSYVSSWASMAPGPEHTCGIRTDRTLWCWGDNSEGELGNPSQAATDNHVAHPVQVGVHADWRAVSTGYFFSCGIRAGGSLWCWGDNSAGELGSAIDVGTRVAHPAPVRVAAGTTWSSVGTGWTWGCAVRTDGTLWCWGDNKYGQLGNSADAGTDVAQPTPTQVGSGSGWTSVTGGDGHTCALKGDHTLWCWGENYAGELGNATNNGVTSANPDPVEVGSGIVSVSAGESATCAVRVDHTLWCWGWNLSGELGNATNVGTNNPNPDPAQVAGTSWRDVSTAAAHTCATRTDGTLWCWGFNYNGELGRSANVGVSVANPVPGRVGARGDWSVVAAGGGDSCALRHDHSLWCWGWNHWGELGSTANLGTDNPNPYPIRVSR